MAKFSFSKYSETLNWIFFFCRILPYTSKNNSQKLLIFFLNSQKRSKQFLICTGENKKNVRFSSVFAFWQAKEQILFQVQPLQMFFYVLAHFRVTVHIFWGPASSENATLRHEILELGPSNNFAQHRMRSFLFFKITPPYWPCFFKGAWPLRLTFQSRSAIMQQQKSFCQYE